MVCKQYLSWSPTSALVYVVSCESGKNRDQGVRTKVRCLSSSPRDMDAYAKVALLYEIHV